LKPDLAFEDALEELEAIVETLERGEPALATALAKYERGVHLLAHCHSLLDGAERTVALLTGVDDTGEPHTAPFDTTATVDKSLPEASSPTSARSVADDDGIPF